MVFPLRTGSRLFKYLRKIFQAGQDITLLMNMGVHDRQIKRIIQNARDRIPSRSLQIPT